MHPPQLEPTVRQLPAETVGGSGSASTSVHTASCSEVPASVGFAWGAPEWSGSASGNWEMCLQQACELQAVKTPLTPQGTELVGSTYIISLTT